jgi:hypothetical protein
MPINPPTPRSKVPRQYLDNSFWRFLLDTKHGAEHPDEPRFKQFSENLRNYVVAGVIWKAGHALGQASASRAASVASHVLVIIGVAAAVLCEAQLFGLSLQAFHWYVGFGFRDQSPRSKWDHWRSQLKMLSLIIVPLILLWTMWKFVSLSATTP